jgi:hypothetical protein
VNRELLVRLLEKTKEGTTSTDKIREGFRITSESFNGCLIDLEKEGLVKINNGYIKATIDQRLKIAIIAVKSGADFQRVSKQLDWKEFEEIVAYTFEENGYKVKRRFRFSAEGRRWEIDVLAIKKPLIVCAECKHWVKSLGNSKARGIIDGHLEKIRVMSENVELISEIMQVNSWGRAIIIPIVLSLIPAKSKIYRRMPMVSVFELPNFLSEFTGQMEWLSSFTVDIPITTLKPKRRNKKG